MIGYLLDIIIGYLVMKYSVYFVPVSCNFLFSNLIIINYVHKD